MNPGQIFSVYTKDKHQEKSTKSECKNYYIIMLYLLLFNIQFFNF